MIMLYEFHDRAWTGGVFGRGTFGNQRCTVWIIGMVLENPTCQWDEWNQFFPWFIEILGSPVAGFHINPCIFPSKGHDSWDQPQDAGQLLQQVHCQRQGDKWFWTPCGDRPFLQSYSVQTTMMSIEMLGWMLSSLTHFCSKRSQPQISSREKVNIISVPSHLDTMELFNCVCLPWTWRWF